MPNMSYCRFTNTLADLQDCYMHLDDSDLSEDERAARAKLLMLCDRIAGEHMEEIAVIEIREAE